MRRRRELYGKKSGTAAEILRVGNSCRCSLASQWRRTQGDAVPHFKYMVECVPHVRYPNGRTGTVTGTRDTTRKSSITEVECSAKSTVMMSDNKV